MKKANIRLKRLRESRKLSIENLSEMLEIGDLALQHFEEGCLEMITINTLIKLSIIFGVTTDYLLGL